MAYDEGLAERVRDAIAGETGITEKKMFGGLAIMKNGNMVAGVLGEQLMARVGADQYAEALAEPHASEMDFTGKSLKGFVYVDEAGVAEDSDLVAWLDRCLRFVNTLSPKQAK